MEKGKEIKVLDYGYVKYIDHLGSDTRVAEAARVSYGQGSKGPEVDKKLLNYLYINHHLSPFEQCSITYEIQMPIFICRQFLRHRTFRANEISGRYTEMPPLFYVPSEWRKQSKKNKQGSAEIFDSAFSSVASSALKQHCKESFALYEDMLRQGVAKEMARMVLPLNLYTRVYVNCDLRNLLHFIELRLDSHAQKEMQDYASAMKQIAAELFPWTFEAFENENNN